MTATVAEAVMLEVAVGVNKVAVMMHIAMVMMG